MRAAKIDNLNIDKSMMMKSFFLLFLAVPLVEIYFLIKIGGMVGAGLTILLVVFTAMMGALLVRVQGFATFARVQLRLAEGQLPAVEMLDGLLLFIAGALLLTPGFFTDAVGFALLTPPLRRQLINHLLARHALGAMAARARSARPGRIIDLNRDDVKHDRPD